MSGVPYHAWTHRPKAEGGTDPIPGMAAGVGPWVELTGGYTDCPTDTWMPIPQSAIAYDPALNPDNSIFDYQTTDEGDTGNDRYVLKLNARGFYILDFGCQWDQVTTDGTEPFGYAVMSLFRGGTAVGAYSSGDAQTWRASMDWMRSDVDGDTSNAPGEQLDNGFLRLCGIFYAPSGVWMDPYAKQTTGVTRGLSGAWASRAVYLGDSPTEPGDWFYDSL